ncbi:alpha/beta fold hydrolase [Mucilaginibacter sp. SG564]|uniref:alpha/beta fold hydrolase n=1 Tax=unclassified Mucilaginibacter TaxID=2617802 RepID=UPI001556B517|nr:alpha/beta hydrolase [Mucilaginibacter sp. SG564]NOW97313.1 pimeloyl-ACP methyl ester carboxylesterase [Mucilaginibacter sp. SG564]
MKILKVSIIIIIFLSGASALILYGFYEYNNKEKKVLTDADRKNIDGKFIKLSQGITHYQLEGPENGEVVILVNGFSVPYYIWDGTYEFLVRNGYRVLRYDMYGRGYSDRPATVYDKNLYNTQLLDLITALKLQGRVNLAGMSFGGQMITNFTCQHPAIINKVILIDPAYESLKPGAPRYVTLYNEAVNSNKRARDQLNDFLYPKEHPGWVKRYLPQMEYKGFRHALVSTMYDYDQHGRQSNLCLNSANKPVLLIWGEKDGVVPFRYSDSIRNVLKVDFFLVRGAAHLPSVEKPDTVNNKILSFLKQR